MQTIDEIKKQLRYGDMKLIAELSGYSYVYVKKVFQKERLNKKIIRIAEELVNQRNKMLANRERK